MSVAVDVAAGAREWEALKVKEGVYSLGPWLARGDPTDLSDHLERPTAAVAGLPAEIEGRARRPAGAGAFGWLSNMGVVLLEGGGSLCYSAILHPEGLAALEAALGGIGALPVRALVAPSPGAHAPCPAACRLTHATARPLPGAASNPSQQTRPRDYR